MGTDGPLNKAVVKLDSRGSEAGIKWKLEKVILKEEGFVLFKP